MRQGRPSQVSHGARAGGGARPRGDVERACGCDTDACVEAREAVRELDRVLSRIDGELRAGRALDLREELFELEDLISLARVAADNE